MSGNLDLIHVTWGPEGEKLSDAEKNAIRADLIAEAEARRTIHDAADKALEGMPFVAVPIEQLADIYERMLRLVSLGQTHISEFESLSEPVKKLRRAVFNEADFGAVYAGQWLPNDVRSEVRAKVKAALTPINN